MVPIDNIDLKILDALQENGRIKKKELARMLGLLSVPSVAERMKKLEEAGIIKGYTAYLDSRKLGRDITAFVLVNIESSKFYPAFLKEVMKICEILECHSVTGEGSYLLKVKTGTLQHLKNCSQESNSC